MKKILITGTSGMLGSTLVSLWKSKYNIYATASNDYKDNPAKNFFKFDLKSPDFWPLLKFADPDIVIHCAAITSHEYCQKHPREAMIVNGESVRKLIKTYSKAKIIFISTDAVFPLETHMANEKTKTGPITIYGKSKELGEKYLLNNPENGCVIRTTIVGKNINQNKTSFAEWIVNSVKEKKEVTLYGDTIFTPISIWNFAGQLEWIMNHRVPSLIHVSGTNIVSKYDFGYNLCRKLNLNLNLIVKVKLNQKIKRSRDQTLNSSLFEKLSGHKLPRPNQTINELYKNFK